MQLQCEAYQDWQAAIRAALGSGGALSLKRCHQAALDGDPRLTHSRLLIMTVDACNQLGRGKQARAWLETLIQHVETGDAFDAVLVAVESRHTDLALQFFAKALAADLPDQARCLEVADKTIDLAESLRLPRRHPSVWRTHVELLHAALALLARMELSSLSGGHDTGSQLVAKAMRLLRSEVPTPRSKTMNAASSRQGSDDP